MIEIHSPDIFEQKRRRNFFILASAFGMIIILIFLIIDYLERDTLEFFIDISIVVILIFGAVGIFKFSMDRIVYIIGLNLVNLAILYNVSIGAGGGMVAILWLYIMPLLIFFFLEITESIVSIILFFFGAIILLVYPSLFGTFDYGTGMSFRFIVSLFFLTIIAHGLESSRYRYSKMLKRSNKELQSEITDRKHTEQALIKSEQSFRNLFNSITDLIYTQDMEGRFISANPATQRLFGYDMDEFIGHRATDFMEPELQSGFDNQYLEVIKEQGYHEGISYYFKKNKEKIYIEHRSSLVKPDDGSEPYISGIGRDVTEKILSEKKVVQLQKQVAQAQKMESVGRLAGGVAHDFNNMLGVILGHVELALLQTDENHDLYSNLNEIQTAAKRSADITKQLLAFARKQTISPKQLDLNDTLESMLNMLRRLIGEDIDLVWKPAAHIWPVKMDPSQIDQILVNLCVNARDAIAGVGKLTIETGRKSFDEEYCKEHPGFIPGDFVQLAVSDNGCGMDKNTLDNLFEPFFTTKEVGKGTGLGLATIYGIVKQNNGFINVYSEPGKGSTFKIYLPRIFAHEDTYKAVPERKATAGGTETILLVEDEPSILRMTRMMLERKGYSVLPAATPGEAIDLAKTHSDKIQLLMTDVVMPEMNGRDLAGQLIPLYPEIKILFMSGYTANVIAHHGVLDDGVAFIQKPFSMVDMAEKVREVLDSAPDNN